jgi:DNA recombination protein RmuC
MTTLELLLLALTGAVVLLALVILVRRPKIAATSSNVELALADRLTGIQSTVNDALGKATKEMADQRVAAAESQRKADIAFLERMGKFEKNVQDSVAAAKKEVTDSKTALDKNAVELNKFMASMGTTIAKLSDQQATAAKVSEDLKFVLQGPKSRGTFGETILEELLERTVPGIWDRQVPIDGGLVDTAVTLKGTIYPIDAKFPKEDYQRFLRGATPAEKEAAWAAHMGAVKAQIDSIARKYVKPEQGTAQFALMFIPSEGMYYDTIADHDPFGQANSIMEYAYEQQVIPAGPTTLFAFLQVIAKGQEGQRLIENAKQLFEQLGKVRGSFDKFYGKYEDVGKALGKAADAYRLGDNHIQRFRDRVDDTLTMNFSLPDEPVPADAAASSAPAVALTPTPPAQAPTVRARDPTPPPAPHQNGHTPTPVAAVATTTVAGPKHKAAFKVEE